MASPCHPLRQTRHHLPRSRHPQRHPHLAPHIKETRPSSRWRPWPDCPRRHGTNPPLVWLSDRPQPASTPGPHCRSPQEHHARTTHRNPPPRPRDNSPHRSALPLTALHFGTDRFMPHARTRSTARIPLNRADPPRPHRPSTCKAGSPDSARPPHHHDYNAGRGTSDDCE